ncbi:MAG TPA: hypothetical protein VHB77_21040 [Planctomycetaceae bacterium]|nr:hypothetical protein [Planctomycetaceae bacterium]
MDCTTAQTRLDALRPDSDAELRTPEWADVAEHLSDCAECQSALHRHREFDRQFARALQNVPVPENGINELRRQLGLVEHADGQASPEEPLAVAEKNPRNNRRRLLAWSVSAAALLVALSGLWWLLPGAAQIDLAAVLERVTSEEFEASTPPAFANSFVPTLPREIRVPDPGAPHSLRSPETNREIGAIYNFRTSWRRKQLEVRLVVFEKRRIRPDELAAVAESFMAAEPRYVNSVAAKIWREGDRVYLCFVRTKGADALESLRSQPLAT